MPNRKSEKHKAYMRARYANDPEHRRKHRARVAVRKAVLRGTLSKAPCEGCGAVKVQAHHDDYSQPLVVRWMCRKCHEAHHGGPGFHGLRVAG